MAAGLVRRRRSDSETLPAGSGWVMPGKCPPLLGVEPSEFPFIGPRRVGNIEN